MRVLFLANPSSTHDNNWISYLAKEGDLKCFLLPRVSHYKNFSNAIEMGDGIEKVNCTLLPPINDFSILRLHRTIYEAFRIKKIIKNQKIDLIHILYAEPNSLWCLFRKFFGIPIIITTRGTDVLKTIPEAFQKRTLLNIVISYAYKRAFEEVDRITATSKKQIKSIVKFSKREKGFSIVRTGVDVPRIIKDTSFFFPLRDDKAFVLFPRNIKPLYNHEFCLEAISLLPSNIKANYKMVFIGKDGGDLEYQEILEKMMMSQIDVDFEFIQKQNQEAIFELYKRASLVVMTPRSDGSPVSGMETMLCQTNLILGPLDYDLDIFSSAIQLLEWDSEELAEKMSLTLSKTDKLIISDKIRMLIDRRYNMRKVLNMYKKCLIN